MAQTLPELVAVLAQLEAERAAREARRQVITRTQVADGTITTTRGTLDADGNFTEIKE